ncbi:unnamed protein product [Auanema sp. JU1783]|nr:unnamed protein product [Auanema sp. JU1783]
MSRQIKLKKLVIPSPQLPPPINLDDKFVIQFTEDEKPIEVEAINLKTVELLGKGAYGVVEKMQDTVSGAVFAVKRIKSTENDITHKQMLIELNACKLSGGCSEMVRFYGAMFREGDVWICMEVMDISMDKFYPKVFQEGNRMPESFVGKVALSVVTGLHFMKEKMNLMHRDVKPSNILLSKNGSIKLCDYGISGNLTNSVAKTIQAGCKPYMAPERIQGDTREAYDVRSDVWSLGITLIEISTGKHPYSSWKTPFDQLKQVVYESPPSLPMDIGYSSECSIFIKKCLARDHQQRPKYPELLALEWLKKIKILDFDIAVFITTNIRD